MPEDQTEMLVSAVDEFCRKFIEGQALRIERTGLDKDLIEKLGSQGFIALKFPEEYGGSLLPDDAYLQVLRTFASYSPSVSLFIAVQNSIIFPLLVKAGETAEILKEIAAGKKSAGFSLSSSTMSKESLGTLSFSGKSSAGIKNYILGPGLDLLLVSADSLPDALLLFTSGFAIKEKYPVLGFRGLGISSVEFSDSSCIVISKENGRSMIESTIRNMGNAVSAIALGIANGAIGKAMEYSKVRSTFGHLLMDYEPVAYPLSMMKSEIDDLSSYIAKWDSLSETEKLSVKIRSVEISIKASRQSIQSHGGYGYLQDFGVEKFYRDSATLPALFMEGQSDKISLSELSYNGKAGFL